MSLYLVRSPHTAEDCLRALDAEMAKGPTVLEKFVYACNDGNHTGYAIIEAKSKTDAWDIVPDFLRRDALVLKVDKFTPEEIRSFHVKAA